MGRTDERPFRCISGLGEDFGGDSCLQRRPGSSAPAWHIHADLARLDVRDELRSNSAMDVSSAQSLSIELEAALLRALREEWARLNWAFFDDEMSEPVLELVDVRSLLGRWVGGARKIELARSFVLEHPWGVVVEVLKHEMAHQYVHEVLNVDEPAHGQAFQAVCRRLAIDSSARGMPKSGTSPNEERILDRVAKLLALAESPNINEAQAAMSAAQKLLLKHNLEHRARVESRGYTFRHVGRPAVRLADHEQRLGGLLAKHFFVQGIWVSIYLPLEAKRATVLELCGTEANLAIADYVYAYLLETAERLWRVHKKQHGGGRGRRSFLSGVIMGFSSKLDKEAERHAGEGLVWVKDANLERYYRTRHPRVRSASPRRGYEPSAFREGHAAGEKIVLHRGVTAGPVARGRLLPSG